ncbi:MAG: alpha-amylase family protein [Lachnospiraceae bacterium]|nr:alpha-amylase family protein [Lachnospiraceae bacterium]
MKKISEFQKRFEQHYDELKWLYCELYHNNMKMFRELTDQLAIWYDHRSDALKSLDHKREKAPDWYKKQNMLGMMLYIDAFADNLSGVEEKLDYLKECNVNYLHLMPFLDTPKGKSDGGYAVSDYRKVQEDLGTMDQLEDLAGLCHKQGMSLCMDFVMNHTSEDHEWAKRALAGERSYRERYFFFDSFDTPAEYEKTCPQVFPTTAPGNFTWREDCGQYVMTTFYPYQWDLNYGNPEVFNEMVYNMLYLVNKGIDILRIDAVPYIWKQLGTSCRNLPQVHTIVRMMRMITEIVCPGVLLLGEVVMEPAKVVPYFGTLEKPECHMLYNVTTMASTWHTIATKDTSLLRHQMDTVCGLPKDYVFLNYLRCHDDIGWGLDYEWLKNFEMNEPAHKKFLNDYFCGRFPGSDARGELYNDDPVLQDARLCGTTASLCGLEAALQEENVDKIEKAVARILMLNAYLFVQSGIPVIYSGDEIGQLNDYSYKESGDADRAADSRYVHRGSFSWENAAKRGKKGSVQKRIFDGMKKMERLRFRTPVFSAQAEMSTLNTYDVAVLGIYREYQGQKLVALFNFSDEEKTAWIDMGAEVYTELFTKKTQVLKHVTVPADGFLWYVCHN